MEQVKRKGRLGKKDGLMAFAFLLLLCLASFLFLSVFSYFTTPFSTCDNGRDAAFFRLVGQGMTKGHLPYRDFFDMKGPFLFFIEYTGQRLSYGRLGIFILQWLNLFLTLLLICRIFSRCGVLNRLLQIGLLLPLAFVASFTFEGGNLTEEFSLIPIFSCLLLSLSFFEMSEKGNEFWQMRMFRCAGAWFGFCFGLLLMIRVTNAALICAMVFVVLISLTKDRKYRQLGVCAGMFIVGLLLSLLPTVWYYSRKGLLNDLLNAVFVLGFRYSEEKTFGQHMTEMILGNRRQLLLLLAVPCGIPLLLRWKTWRERLLVISGALFTFFAVASGNNYTHYYTLAIPLIVLCEIAAADSLQTKIDKRGVIAAVLAVIMLLSQASVFKLYLMRAYSHLFRQDSYHTAQDVKDVSSRIPEEDYGSVYCYNIEPAWYTYADLFPCIKYCGWQNHYIALMPEIYDDLKRTFEDSPPAWLVLPEYLGSIPSFLEERLGKDYRISYENESYILYHYPGQHSG